MKTTILDTGEYLPGARKDDHETHEIPAPTSQQSRLPKIDDWWPLPDWAGMVERGEIQADVACYLHFFRKNLAKQPPYEFRAKGISNEDWDRYYIKATEVILSLLPAIRTLADYKKANKEYNRLMGWPNGDHPASKDNTVLCPTYAIGRSTHRTMNHPWTIPQMSWFRQHYLHYLGWPTNPAIKDNCRFLVCDFTSKKELRPQWAAVECVGNGVVRVGELTPSLEKAIEDALAKVEAEKPSRKAPEYITPKRPSLSGKVVRIGPDWRNNGDVTPEKFMETFGFRGVQWGEWVPQKERQGILNSAFDSFHDLMELFELPLMVASFTGSLGISFGARGKGFVSGAAHFEPDNKIIHLTRMSGAGSIAHEWAHALDYSLGQAAKARFKSGDFFSEAVPPSQWKTKMGIDKNPSCKAMHRVIVSMTRKNSDSRWDDSNFHENARMLSSNNKSNYWDSMKEMFARSFEAIVYDLLSVAGRQCDYLVYGVEEDRFGYDKGNAGNPYPVGRERAQIAQSIVNAMNIWKQGGRIG